jgi:hypothetical protein
MKFLARRIHCWNSTRATSPRRIHIVTAVDEPDRDRKMADLVEAGVIGARDGFLCLLGKPRAHCFYPRTEQTSAGGFEVNRGRRGIDENDRRPLSRPLPIAPAQWGR